MKIKTAYEVYTTEKLNCTQSILKGHRNDFNVSDKMIEDYLAYGSGRADGNMCGALFAAVQLVESEDVKKRVIAGFEEQAGTTKCKVIKREGKISCKECVRIASEVLSSTFESI